jgi:hypothetical protein
MAAEFNEWSQISKKGRSCFALPRLIACLPKQRSTTVDHFSPRIQ